MTDIIKRHFTGNGYGFDGVWRHDSQRITATKEALFICREWIDGREGTLSYRDAIMTLYKLHPDMKHGLRQLYVASLTHFRENPEARLVYYDAGMEYITNYLRRHTGALKFNTGWEHHNQQNGSL